MLGLGWRWVGVGLDIRIPNVSGGLGWGWIITTLMPTLALTHGFFPTGPSVAIFDTLICVLSDITVRLVVTYISNMDTY